MSAMRFASWMLNTVKKHPGILPLLGACSYSGSLAVVMLGYTSFRKADVQWNRWGSSSPQDRINWTKPTQKILMTSSDDYAGYKPQFDQELKMHQLIYEDGDYRA